MKKKTNHSSKNKNSGLSLSRLRVYLYSLFAKHIKTNNVDEANFYIDHGGFVLIQSEPRNKFDKTPNCNFDFLLLNYGRFFKIPNKIYKFIFKLNMFQIQDFLMTFKKESQTQPRPKNS